MGFSMHTHTPPDIKCQFPSKHCNVMESISLNSITDAQLQQKALRLAKHWASDTAVSVPPVPTSVVTGGIMVPVTAPARWQGTVCLSALRPVSRCHTAVTSPCVCETRPRRWLSVCVCVCVCFCVYGVVFIWFLPLTVSLTLCTLLAALLLLLAPLVQDALGFSRLL